MKQIINLGAETVAFVRIRMEEILAENPQNISRVEFNVKEVKDQVFHLFYDYQVCRGWPHVAENTANILGYEHRSINKMLKRKSPKNE